ncbi:MAG: patatin-like phospholipase family protein [Isosphaeraceae bacterium]
MIRGTRRRALGLLLALGAMTAMLGGCASVPKTAIPVDPNTRISHVMTSFGPIEVREVYIPGQGVIRHAVGSGQSAAPTPPKRSDGTVGYDLLALSGGGSNGAFGAGVLKGWTRTGTRPQFQIVTGISAGSLLSSFAFAGPEFDDRLEALFTTMTNDQIFKRKSIFKLPWSDSLASTEPLSRLIAFQLDQELLEAVARGDREGRRLYVGTTHLDVKRLVIWDMGSIASSGHPGAAELYGRVLLASSSIPVVFNPVEFEVMSEGRALKEVHVDGGTRAQVFLRSVLVRNLARQTETDAPHRADDSPGTGRPFDLTGSRLWVVVNGKLQADPSRTRRDLLPIAAESLNAMMHAKSSADLIRMYAMARTTGMEYRLLAIPQNAPNVPPPAEFDPIRMTALFRIGSDLVARPSSWARAPRGLDEAESLGYERDAEASPRKAAVAARPEASDAESSDDHDAESGVEADDRSVKETQARRPRWQPRRN